MRPVPAFLAVNTDCRAGQGHAGTRGPAGTRRAGRRRGGLACPGAGAIIGTAGSGRCGSGAPLVTRGRRQSSWPGEGTGQIGAG